MLILLALLAASLFGQNIEVYTVPFLPPCEEGEWLFGSTTCPPADQQGVFVHVRSTGEFQAYEVTVEYRTDQGETKKSVETVPRRNDDGFHTGVFVIGRVKARGLPGITIDAVTVRKL